MAHRSWMDDETTDRTREDRSRRGYEDRDRERGRGMFFDEDRERRRLRDDERLERGRGRRDEDFERGFGPDDHNRGIPMDETARLIASNKVEGTAVFDRHGERLGSIHNFMVDKFTGEVKYAVLRHSSGFLGLGEHYYPLEWADLTYDTRRDGYRVNLVEDDLRDMRSFGMDREWRRSPRGMRRDEQRGRSFDDDRFERGRSDRW